MALKIIGEKINSLIEENTKTFVFIFFFLIFFLVLFSNNNFLSFDDQFYHARHASTYITGEKMSLPVYSSMNVPGADLYPLYHALLSLFMFDFSGENFNVLVNGSKLFHIIVSAFVFVTFYYVIFRLLNKSEEKFSQRQISQYSLI